MALTRNNSKPPSDVVEEDPCWGWKLKADRYCFLWEDNGCYPGGINEGVAVCDKLFDLCVYNNDNYKACVKRWMYRKYNPPDTASLPTTTESFTSSKNLIPSITYPYSSNPYSSNPYFEIPPQVSLTNPIFDVCDIKDSIDFPLLRNRAVTECCFTVASKWAEDALRSIGAIPSTNGIITNKVVEALRKVFGVTGPTPQQLAASCAQSLQCTTDCVKEECPDFVNWLNCMMYNRKECLNDIDCEPCKPFKDAANVCLTRILETNICITKCYKDDDALKDCLDFFEDVNDIVKEADKMRKDCIIYNRGYVYPGQYPSIEEVINQEPSIIRRAKPIISRKPTSNTE